MLLLRLWNYLRGYVIIVVEGYFLEKFINICTHRQLLLWNIRWLKNSRMTMKISINGFKTLRPIAFKTKCRVHIIDKKGLPFILHRYKKRKTFVFGVLVFLAFFFFMTSFVWDVSISGNNNVKSELLLEQLAQSGIRPGALKFGINTAKAADQLMLEINELSRISIAVKGTRVLVDVGERVKPPELINKNIPCNIVAVKDGIITSIMAKEGLEVVKVGQTVIKGQILITGIIENKYDNKEMKPLIVHSIGIVKARTWYEASAPVELKKLETRRTGREKDLYTFFIFARKIKLFQGKVPFSNCEHIEIKNNLSIGKNMIMPIGIIRDKYFEYEIAENEINIDEARTIAANKAMKLALDQIPPSVKIVKKDVSIVQGDSGISTATAIVECIEDIGATQEIGGQ